MRISEIHITPVAVPDPPLLNAAGLHAPYALRLIIEIVSAESPAGAKSPGAKQRAPRWSKRASSLSAWIPGD